MKIFFYFMIFIVFLLVLAVGINWIISNWSEGATKIMDIA